MRRAGFSCARVLRQIARCAIPSQPETYVHLMKNLHKTPVSRDRCPRGGRRVVLAVGAALLMFVVLTGCRSSQGGGSYLMEEEPVLFPSTMMPDPVAKPVDVAETNGLDVLLYRLQPRDTVGVQVFREPEISGTFRLSGEGDIRHPLLGNVALGGLTITEAEQLLQERLAADYLVNPRVILKVEEMPGMQILLMGEVRRPGSMAISHGERVTLLEAIARAGGFTEMASPNRVRVVRTRGSDNETLDIRVGDILAGRGDERDIVLEPNDVVTVPEVRF
jgi:protein involved in polysaccharide export with SLBB domain